MPPSRQAEAKSAAQELAAGLRARDERDSIPTQAGFCFHGGIFLHSRPWRREKDGLGFYFSQYPVMFFAFIVSNTFSDDASLFSKEKDSSLYRPPSSQHMLRRDELTLAGLPAQERCVLKDDLQKGSAKLYDFKLTAPGVGQRL